MTIHLFDSDYIFDFDKLVLQMLYYNNIDLGEGIIKIIPAKNVRYKSISSLVLG